MKFTVKGGLSRSAHRNLPSVINNLPWCSFELLFFPFLKNYYLERYLQSENNSVYQNNYDNYMKFRGLATSYNSGQQGYVLRAMQHNRVAWSVSNMLSPCKTKLKLEPEIPVLV